MVPLHVDADKKQKKTHNTRLNMMILRSFCSTVVLSSLRWWKLFCQRAGEPWRHQEVRSAGGAAVVGHVLQAAQQRRVVFGTDPFGRRLVLQRHAALPGGSLSGPDHTVDLLEALRGQRSQVSQCEKTEHGHVLVCDARIYFGDLLLLVSSFMMLLRGI